MKMLAIYMICLSPVPPACFTPDHMAFLTNPVCVAVSKDCTVYEDMLEGEGLGFQDCVAWAASRLALYRAHYGYARGSYPTCGTVPDRGEP